MSGQICKGLHGKLEQFTEFESLQIYNTYAATFKVDLLDQNRNQLVGYFVSSRERDKDKEKADKFKPQLLSDSESVHYNERPRLIEEHEHSNIYKPS